MDAGNAVPLYLAAQAYGAKQLSKLCEYWMAVDVAESKQHEQWGELNDNVKAIIEAEHKRLEETRAKKREEKKLMEKLPCLLAPIIPAPPAAAPKGK